MCYIILREYENIAIKHNIGKLQNLPYNHIIYIPEGLNPHNREHLVALLSVVIM